MALIESILFAWVFGMDRGWAEMLKGAELQVPRVFLLHSQVHHARFFAGDTDRLHLST